MNTCAVKVKTIENHIIARKLGVGVLLGVERCFTPYYHFDFY